MNSKLKGGRGEREFAALCRSNGYGDVQRGQQFQGGVESPDVKGLPGVHIEVKRVERLNIHEAMSQAIRDSEGKAMPIVAHRRNREDWMITMVASDWFKLYRRWNSGRTHQALRDELVSFYELCARLREKYGIFIDEVSVNAKFSDGTFQTYDIYEVLTDCAEREEIEEEGLFQVLYGEIIRLKTKDTGGD